MAHVRSGLEEGEGGERRAAALDLALVCRDGLQADEAQAGEVSARVPPPRVALGVHHRDAPRGARRVEEDGHGLLICPGPALPDGQHVCGTPQRAHARRVAPHEAGHGDVVPIRHRTTHGDGFQPRAVIELHPLGPRNAVLQGREHERDAQPRTDVQQAAVRLEGHRGQDGLIVLSSERAVEARAPIASPPAQHPLQSLHEPPRLAHLRARSTATRAGRSRRGVEEARRRTTLSPSPLPLPQVPSLQAHPL